MLVWRRKRKPLLLLVKLLSVLVGGLRVGASLPPALLVCQLQLLPVLAWQGVVLLQVVAVVVAVLAVGGQGRQLLLVVKGGLLLVLQLEGKELLLVVKGGLLLVLLLEGKELLLVVKGGPHWLLLMLLLLEGKELVVGWVVLLRWGEALLLAGGG